MSDNSQGNGAPGASNQGAGASAGIDEDRIAQIAAQVVNQAFSARSKTLKKEIAEDFGKQFESFTKSLDEKFAAVSAPKSGKGDKARDVDGMTPEMAAMKRQLEEMSTKLSQSEAREKEAIERTRSTNRRQRAIDELGRHGITGAHARAALAQLNEDGLIVDDEDNPEVTLFHDRLTGDRLPLADGVRSWAKTDEAKIFLPPTGARGSGDRAAQARNTNASTNNAPTHADIGNAILAAFGGTTVG